MNLTLAGHAFLNIINRRAVPQLFCTTALKHSARQRLPPRPTCLYAMLPAVLSWSAMSSLKATSLTPSGGGPWSSGHSGQPAADTAGATRVRSVPGGSSPAASISTGQRGLQLMSATASIWGGDQQQQRRQQQWARGAAQCVNVPLMAVHKTSNTLQCARMGIMTGCCTSTAVYPCSHAATYHAGKEDCTVLEMACRGTSTNS